MCAIIVYFKNNKLSVAYYQKLNNNNVGSNNL